MSLRTCVLTYIFRAYVSSCLQLFRAYVRSFVTFYVPTTTQDPGTDIHPADVKSDEN